MPSYSNEEVSTVKQRLIDGMLGYMEPDEDEPASDFDPGYTKQDVERCAALLDSYLSSLSATAPLPETEIRGAVQAVVTALNELNEECDCCLIETDQREDLCQLILVSAQKAGLDTDEDITEEWREW